MNDELQKVLADLELNGRLQQEKSCWQHGGTTVYEHSVHVAQVSLRLAEKLPLKINETALIRGALLHDYFLYDWHEKNSAHSLHGFRHPRFALNNAQEDFTLNEIEENMILRHMFPLTPIPPVYREAWILCLVDKYCALGETMPSFFARFWRGFLKYGA